MEGHRHFRPYSLSCHHLKFNQSYEIQHLCVVDLLFFKQIDEKLFIFLVSDGPTLFNISAITSPNPIGEILTLDLSADKLNEVILSILAFLGFVNNNFDSSYDSISYWKHVAFLFYWLNVFHLLYSFSPNSKDFHDSCHFAWSLKMCFMCPSCVAV